MSILDIQEPMIVIPLTFISWIVSLVVWIISPENILIPLLISISLTIFASYSLFIDTGSESSSKVDKNTGKHRCRVCHRYFQPEELLYNTCSTCRQVIN